MLYFFYPRIMGGNRYQSMDYSFQVIGLFIWMSSVICCVNGECLHAGSAYNNNSVWQPDACTVCTCDDPVSICESITCVDPRCDYSKGEKLELLPDRCCPVCSYKREPCDFRGQSVPHNTEWTPSACVVCQCGDGEVKCTNSTCPNVPCRPGEVSQNLPGQCCPRCIPTGRSCVDSNGSRKPDGEEWSPMECVKCVCRDGNSRCMPAQCPQIRCEKGIESFHQPGECCPSCREELCSLDNQLYQEGEEWIKDACTFCTCRSGRVSCRSLACDPNLSCSQSQMKVTKDGECCPQCVPKEDSCHDNSNIVRYHGDVWQTGPCEFCACRHGKVKCRTATCGKVTCLEDEILTTSPEQCCPRCEIPKTCQLEGQVYQDGQSWDPDVCSTCTCQGGHVTCFKKTCPACQAGTARVASKECCGSCQKVHCSDECSSCSSSDARHCTQCREPSKLVQDGRCVDQCRTGFYPGRDNKCHACHESCHTCYDKFAHTCLSCPPLYLMKDGQCVRQCGEGYFRRDTECYSCHRSCSACIGPRQDQCVVCSIKGQVLMRGRCVDRCGVRSFLQGQECQACPSPCASCVADSPECASCPNDKFLHRGQCLPACNRGLFVDDYSVCQACHPSCLECNGPGEEDCTACHHGQPTAEGQCSRDIQCRTGQYLNSNLICEDCSPGCSRCHSTQKGIDSACSLCLDLNLVPSGSMCRDRCMQGMFLRDDICYPCDEKCEHCDGPTQCVKCYLPFLNFDGHCVMDCGPGRFPTQEGMCLRCSPNCLECSDVTSCHSCDASTLLKDSRCVVRCGDGFVTRLQERVCEENTIPPLLDVRGSLTVTEGGMDYITDSFISVADADTPVKYLTVILEALPTAGRLMKDTKLGNFLMKQGDEISMKDLRLGLVQFLHDAGTGNKGYLTLKAYDGQLSSDVIEVPIYVRPDETLQLVSNKPLLANTGLDTQLTMKELGVKSSIPLGEVVVLVLDGPLYGQFLNSRSGKAVTKFTLDMVTSGVIVYHYYGNKSDTMDMARLQMTDGFHHLEVLLSIIVQSKASKLPVVLSNSGGHVFKGDMLKISSDLLEVKVQDSQHSSGRDAIYTLIPTSDNPRNGKVMMMVPTPQEGPGSGWTDMGDGMMGAQMFRFMQRDIDEGRIYYKHLGEDAVPDRFTFEVADSSNPPNILRDQEFQITVIENEVEALSLPTLAPGVRLGMTVLENQIVPITAAHLAFNDLDTQPEDLVYRITSLLREDEGSIEHVLFPFSPVLQFTQSDIDNGRIIYRPPDEEIGTEEKEVSFNFVVTDGGEERQLTEHKFTVRVVPVNNNPPFFLNPNPEVSLAEGGIFPLTSGLLEVLDPDTKLDDLEVTVVEAPSRGIIEKLQEGIKVVVRTGDKFSYTDIMSSTFQYVHTGGIVPPRDQLSLSVTDGTHQTGNIINFSIIKVDKSAPTMLPSATCHVNVTEGMSVDITRDQMAFSDMDNSDEGIQIILAVATTHGYLKVKDGSEGHKVGIGDSFTQADINDGRLSFVADQEIGSKAVTELVYFNVSDLSRNLLPSQILSVLITPVDNLPPAIVIGPNLKVDEGGETMLESEMISVLDVDTPLSNLKFVLDTQPTFGVIQNRKPAKGSEKKWKRKQKSIKSFMLSELVDGHIYYVQSDHKNKEPAWDAFLFSVSDGTNESPLQRFNISIKLINDEAPRIITEQLFAQEGKTVTLTNASMYVIDLDTAPQDLIFTLTNTPNNGQLLKKEFILDPIEKAVELREKATFSYEDVLNELVVYKHDDGETTQDSFTLHLTDGDFGDTKTLNIMIGLLNDETPRVTINRGLRLKAGSSSLIKSGDLRATDLDSEDSDILFTIMKDPSTGHLQFNNGHVTYILTASGMAKTFKQADIDSGYISYVHPFGEETGNILFKFKLTDPEGNDLIDQDFLITVLEDRLLPTEVNNKEFLVTEGKQAKLTTEFLSFTDADTEPGSLTYTVLEGPDLGHLELIGQPGVPIVTFTQSDLAANTVIYMHTSPSEEFMDRFTFTVSDGTNEIVQAFFINISPVDDAIPLLTNKGMRVQEGVRKLVTEFELKAVDEDTKEHLLLFTVVEPPVYGSLDLFTEGSYFEAVTFTMEDIYENRVSYEHDGSETTHDSFKFVVSDGTNNVFAMQKDQPAYKPVDAPQDFDISILPLDDGMPVIETNLGLQFLASDGVETGNLITANELSATDEDTPPSDVVFVITDPPKFGILENVGNPGLQVMSFTQVDINNALIRYRLTQASPGLQDSFSFDVMDSKPNLVPGNKFHIMWSEISLGLPVFNVSESQRVMRVPILRRGNLKQYSIVKCRTLSGSATSRSDINRPGLQDFIPTDGQVQFDDWQESKDCNIVINDDSVFEGPETFYVEILSPTFAILGSVRKAAITIYDAEDEPSLQFLSDVTYVNETDNYAMVTIVRSGDVSETVSVICFTKSLTATGSSLKGLESGSDYVSRGQTNSYRVVFPPGVTQATCDVKLIDDSQYESMEQFEVSLSDPSIPASLGSLASSLVIIGGPNDVSLVYLSNDNFAFPEDIGTVEIEILREGSDLSHTSMVWCATRLSDIASAAPGEDYMASSTQITFGPGQTSQICHLVLLDDEFEPRLEGNETFDVFLRSAMGSTLDQPFVATVTIYDDHLDISQMTFAQDSYIVDEKNKTLNATVVRLGDITLESSVICYTRQQTAQVMMDYDERTLTNSSRITFKPGERSKPCIVGIVDDEDFELDEIFLLKLAQPLGTDGVPAKLGELDVATITITNHDDVPKIQFEQSAYSVHEPSVIDQITTVNIKVIRTGAVNETASVRCSTRDGSAQSGLDYNPKSIVLEFNPGVREIKFPVDVLYNSAIEWHESFSVQLGPEHPSNSMFGLVTMATITILDNEVSGSIVLPAPPIVVSLLNYADTEQGVKVNPSPGYPLICLTPCDVHYPNYPTTAELCDQAGINQTAMLYHWEVASPPTEDGVMPLFVRITDKTLFTSVNKRVLESIYFRSFFQVRCVAQPLHENMNPGVPLKSVPVTIGHSNPICKSMSFPQSNSVSYQAQSFLATLEYVTPEHSDHPNTVHISVQIPHQDGMLPLISTHPLHNLRFLLSEPVYRQQHICSNIITAAETAPLLDQGFLGDYGNDLTNKDSFEQEVFAGLPYGPGYDFPHQFDSELRDSQSLLLYKHLNLKSCIWQFDAWYHMTELVDLCGGRVVSDFQIKGKSETHLTVRVPLYVSYVYATAPTGWGSLEHRTEMEFSFYYSTVLWRSGLETEGRQGGKLQMVRILIGDDGKLVMEFRTQAKFRGQFVLKHHTLPGMESRILAPEAVAITFDLELVWSQNTFDSPYQVWRATSGYNLKDYTGVYQVELVPCLVSATQQFVPSDPLPCAAQQLQRFEVPISFQQTNRPVPVTYSLNTDFQLSNNLKMFLLDPSTEGMGKEDWDFNGAFARGQKLYGRVLWNPDQDLSTAYKLSLEKVYICTGSDGYVPTYDPSGETYSEGPQFGCIQPSKKLLHRFLILDRKNPDVTSMDFHQIPFNAKLASEDPQYLAMVELPGVDGFVMDIDPLYKVDSGHQWYLQVVYTIGPSGTSGHRLRRSAMFASSSLSLSSLQTSSSDQYSPSSAMSKPSLAISSSLHSSLKRSKRSLKTIPDESRTALTSAENNIWNKGDNDKKLGAGGNPRNGTNMKILHLTYDKELSSDFSSSFPTVAIVAVVTFVLLMLIILLVVCVRKRRRKWKDQEASAPNVQIMKNNLLQTKRNPQSHARSLSDTYCKPQKEDSKTDVRNSLSSINKCNIIRPKDVNVLAQQGISVENGTEV